MTPILTINDLMRRASKELKKAGIDSAELDARVLLEAAIEKKAHYIFSHPEAPITNADYAQFRRYIRRRKKGEPVAYILGHKEFYGLDFLVNKNVLIPRPETELLVEETLNRIKNKELRIKGQKKELKIIDVGTGSGCVIISLALALLSCHSRLDLESRKSLDHRAKPEDDRWGKARYYATDISKKALSVAKKNAKRILLEAGDRELPGRNSSRYRLPARRDDSNNIKFYYSDLFSNQRLPKKFDIIIANLPYVPNGIKNNELRIKDEKEIKSPNSTFLIPNSISFEPKNAIFAKDSGAAIIKRFIDQAKDRINPGGLILIELDPRNASDILKYSKKSFPNTYIELKKDLANLDRYLRISL